MKQKVELSQPYPSILGSYGGNQTWFAEKSMRQAGCGVVAAGDLLIYLSMYRKGCRTEETHGIFYGDGSISKPRYGQYIKGLRRRYFPLIPRLGMPYWVLVVGLNRYFRKYQIPLQASWGVCPWNLQKRMEEMLKANIPVILAVGPNFPWLLRKEKLNFYSLGEDGESGCAAQTSAHYVVATASGDKTIAVSSWGKSYVIRWEEYKKYARSCSSYLTSNLCYIRERKK